MGIIEAIKLIAIEEGIEEGQKLKTLQFIKNLFQKTDLDVSKIAQLAGVTEDFVEQIKRELFLNSSVAD